jgi:hypothetical protein
VGRIKRGGGDGGEPARSPPGRLSFRRLRNRSFGCDICRRAERSRGSARLLENSVTKGANARPSAQTSKIAADQQQKTPLQDKHIHIREELLAPGGFLLHRITHPVKGGLFRHRLVSSSRH